MPSELSGGAYVILAVAIEHFYGIGVRKGDRACIWMGNSIEWVCCFFGLSKIGAIIVPINTRFKAEEAGYIFQKVKPTTIVVNDFFLNILFDYLI